LDFGHISRTEIDKYQPELLIAILLENAAKEDNLDKQKSGCGWKTSRKILNYGIYKLKMPLQRQNCMETAANIINHRHGDDGRERRKKSEMRNI